MSYFAATMQKRDPKCDICAWCRKQKGQLMGGLCGYQNWEPCEKVFKNQKCITAFRKK
jgi:hypothetical protein